MATSGVIKVGDSIDVVNHLVNLAVSGYVLLLQKPQILLHKISDKLLYPRSNLFPYNNQLLFPYNNNFHYYYKHNIYISYIYGEQKRFKFAAQARNDIYIIDVKMETLKIASINYGINCVPEDEIIWELENPFRNLMNSIEYTKKLYANTVGLTMLYESGLELKKLYENDLKQLNEYYESAQSVLNFDEIELVKLIFDYVY